MRGSDWGQRKAIEEERIRESPACPDEVAPKEFVGSIEVDRCKIDGKSQADVALEAALYYANELGYAVVPMHSAPRGWCSCSRHSCQSQGKHPRTQHGVRDATTFEPIVFAWWIKEHVGANVGIATGQESGIVVLDVDPRNGGRARSGRSRTSPTDTDRPCRPRPGR